MANARECGRGSCQDVADRVRHLPWRRERARVVPVREHRTAPSRQRIEALRDANGQPLHSAGQALRAFCLDDEMNVISLNRIVDDAHPEAVFRPLKRLLQLVERTPASEVPDAVGHAHGHVQRRETLEHLARAMRNAGAPPFRLSSCVFSSSAAHSLDLLA